MNKTLKISDIKPNPNNPRIIKDDKFKKLVESIKSFPEMLDIRPIVVNKDMIILGGNMRFLACKEAGLKEIPVIVAHLTEKQENEFIIKDNVSGGEWDWDILANEWDKEELEEWGLDVQFETVEPEAEEDDFEVDEGIKTDIVLGDLFEIGPHRLLCGDSTNIDDVNKLMNGEKADMVFTDPPYGMNLDTDFSDIKGGNYKKVKGDNDDFTPKLITTVFDNFGYCKEIMLWGADYFAELIPNKNDGAWLIWDKREGEGIEKNGNPDAMIGSMFETLWSKHRRKREIIRFQWAGSFGLHQDDVRRVHPTQKPYKMLIEVLKKTKDIKKIVDLYMGSGSTMVACHVTERICYGIEYEPEYVQTIVNRMMKLDSSIEVKKNGKPYLQSEI